MITEDYNKVAIKFKQNDFASVGKWSLKLTDTIR